MHYLESELRERLVQDKEMQAFLLDKILDGYWYWDLEDQSQEFMSDTFWQALGVDPDSKTHNPDQWMQMIDPAHLESATENFVAHLADPNHPYDQWVKYTNDDGKVTWVRCWGMAVRDEQGQPKRMLGAHIDVTDLIEQKQRNEAFAAFLDESNRSLTDVTAVLVHDLRTPLRAVSGMSDLLAEELTALYGELPAEITEKLTKIRRSAATIGSIADDLSSFVRVGQPEGDVTQVSLAKLVKDAAEDLPSSAFNVQIDPTIKVSVYQATFVKALREIIRNTFEHNPDWPGLKCWIDAESDQNRIVLTIQDNGQGLSAPLQAVAFSPMRGSARPNETRSGMGLAYARRAISAVGGRVGLDTSPSKGGCRVTIQLTVA